MFHIGSATISFQKAPLWRKLTLAFSCSSLLAMMLALHNTAPDLGKALDPRLAPYPLFVALYAGSGIAFLIAVTNLVRLTSTFYSVTALLGFGIVLRAIMLFAPPMIEDDYHRYLLDGALTANGHSPYKFSPKEILEAGPSIPNAVIDLSNNSRDTVEQINHPHLRTIYPPTAQAGFALSHMLFGWNELGWRLLMLLCEFGVVGFLLAIMRKLGRSPHFVAIYVWNPIAIREFSNAGHLEPLLLVMLVAGLFFALSERRALATFALCLAAGVKIWPIALLPLLWRPLLRKNSRDLRLLALCVGLTVALIGAMVWPIASSSLGSDSAFVRYAQAWQNNDGFFRILHEGIHAFLNGVGNEAYKTDQYARRLAGLLFAGIIAALSLRPATDRDDEIRRWLLAISALFLLSPTQFPWYYTWLLPLLALRPTLSLLCYTPLLSLYPLQYYFEAHGDAQIFYTTYVWIEHAPIWLLIAWEWHKRAGPWPRTGLA